ncbi:amidohydrolase [Pseudomonas capsici]|uniref:amidohydrolase n=1 Tax=Pseudomonas capsici TaxID=2810614 RepID=UPI0021F0C487|nr:amidohydrolase [Pseudomonas capsici]MCV4282720.1 amidohydrolase [Pseudomonas capsici]
MSERFQFGCACCSPHMLPVYQHDHSQWQDLLAEVARQEGPRGLPQAVIFHGGHIYPDPENPERSVEAIGIAQGKVIAIGSYAFVCAEMAPYSPLERPLATDETLLPGLIDPHAHLVSSALMTTWTDLSPFDGQDLNTDYDLELIKDRLRKAVKAASEATPPQEWVTGYGVDPSLMTVWKDIDVTLLNEISTKVKIFLLNASGHISYANGPALEAAGFARDYQNGVLTEQQSQAIVGAMPPTTPQQILDGLKIVFRQANERGITTVFDASVGLIAGTVEVPLMKGLATTSAMTVRVGGALYGNSNDFMTWIDCYKPELSSDANSLFTLRAIKLIADGSNQGLTGLQSQPYHCCEEHSVPGVGAYGLFNYDPVRKLAEVMALANSAGWPILTHANGDEGIANVLAAYQMALSKVPPPPAPKRPFPTEPAWAEQRHRIEHASLLHDDAIGLMKRMAISPSFLIGHVGYWGKAFRDTILGGERALLLDRCASALKAGLRISLHSDHFVTPFGPLRYMEQSIGRVMEALKGKSPANEDDNVLNPDERLNVHQALRAVTIDAAWQCHLDHQIGSLLKDKQADLVILAKNPLQWPVFNAAGMRDIKVVETWVNGSRVFSAPL